MGSDTFEIPRAQLLNQRQECTQCGEKLQIPDIVWDRGHHYVRWAKTITDTGRVGHQWLAVCLACQETRGDDEYDYEVSLATALFELKG